MTPILSTITQFSTLSYLIFLLITVLLYYIFKKSFYFLLVASILFYATFSVKYCLLIILLCLFNYGAGLLLAKYKSKKILLASILVNIGVLGYFRYTNFFLDNLNTFLLNRPSSPVVEILIPLGISFFTFELIHYIVDVYRGKKPVTNVWKFLLFPFFFPSQIAGPIKRFEEFIPQLANQKIDWPLISDGIFLLIKGLFKKIVIADSLASFVAKGFDSPADPATTIIAIYAFAFQIYFDFSGYTDIGRGSGALLNIRLPQNFMQPYLATNMQDFWRRWHITLMNWFRDYVYIPLGGSRVSPRRKAFNILVVFFISGLWHGAAWHFVFWGLYNGVLVLVTTTAQRVMNYMWPMVENTPAMGRKKHKNTAALRSTRLAIGLSRQTTKFGNVQFMKFKNLIAIFITFHLVCIGWVFFRAKDIETALAMLGKVAQINLEIPMMNPTIIYILILLMAYLLYGRIMTVLRMPHALAHTIKLFAFGIAIIFIVLHTTQQTTQFIYFQF